MKKRTKPNRLTPTQRLAEIARIIEQSFITNDRGQYIGYINDEQKYVIYRLAKGKP